MYASLCLSLCLCVRACRAPALASRITHPDDRHVPKADICDEGEQRAVVLVQDGEVVVAEEDGELTSSHPLDNFSQPEVCQLQSDGE